MRRVRLVCGLSLLLLLLAACSSDPPAAALTTAAAPAAGTPVRPNPYGLTPVPEPTPTASIFVAFVTAQPTSAPLPAPTVDAGLRATLDSFEQSVGSDPEGSKTIAYNTLTEFVDPGGMYAWAWWFEDDGRADIYEILAVVLYTEGHTNMDVRAAVAARYLWFCGGKGANCQGNALINFLAYFQPWRQPWSAPGFTNAQAAEYLSFAQDIVHQRPGLLTALIPGADKFVHHRDSLDQGGPIDWYLTPFHFANVHPTWDGHLRQQLRRSPNGPARLWVLTIGEASRVCPTRFICPDMTRARN